MYSPKIDEELIPRLYRLRKLKKIPMTRLVNGILENALLELEKEATARRAMLSQTLGTTSVRRLDDVGFAVSMMIGYVALLRGTCRNERFVGPHSE